MKKVLYILGELSDSDIDWLIFAGKRESLPQGTRLIQEGRSIDALYIILDGKFAVSTMATAALGQKEIARLGCGEIVGEMSFIDARPPSATVRSLEQSLVLSVPRSAVIEKLQQDEGFSARFHRALCVFLSDRLRSTVSRLGYSKDQPMDESIEYEDELDPNVLDTMALAGTRFDWLLQRLRGQ